MILIVLAILMLALNEPGIAVLLAIIWALLNL